MAAMDVEGGIKVDINIVLSAKTLMAMPPEVVATLMEGIARILAARAAIEG